MKSFEIKGTRPIDGRPQSVTAHVDGEDSGSAVERAYVICPGLCVHKVTELEHYLFGGESLAVDL